MGSTQSMLAVNIYFGEGKSMSEFIAKEEYIFFSNLLEQKTNVVVFKN